jgi:hypothetical protein
MKWRLLNSDTWNQLPVWHLLPSGLKYYSFVSIPSGSVVRLFLHQLYTVGHANTIFYHYPRRWWWFSWKTDTIQFDTTMYGDEVAMVPRNRRWVGEEREERKEGEKQQKLHTKYDNDKDQSWCESYWWLWLCCIRDGYHW